MASLSIARALRAGVAAYAIAVLLAGLAGAPLVAGDDFAHSHPEGVAAHVHPISQVLPGEGVVATRYAVPMWTLLLVLTIAIAAVIVRRVEGAVRSRAPPPTV